MVQYIKLNNAEEWKDFVKLAWQFDSDISVHTDDQMIDAKSLLNILALDRSKPIRVVTEDARFMRTISGWAIKQPA